jgi:hypothetical protein
VSLNKFANLLKENVQKTEIKAHLDLGNSKVGELLGRCYSILLRALRSSPARCSTAERTIKISANLILEFKFAIIYYAYGTNIESFPCNLTRPSLVQTVKACYRENLRC